MLPVVFNADANVKHNAHVADDEDGGAHEESVQDYAVSGIAVR